MRESKFLNLKMVCEHIHYKRSTIYKMVRKNSIPHIKLGSKTLFDREQIDKWVMNGGRMNDEDLPQLPKL